MKLRNVFIAIFTLGLLAVSCQQDPIFYIISTETVPRKPRVEGAPTNMVVFEREYLIDDPDNPTVKVPILYVASGKLHWYAKADMGSGDSTWGSKETDEYGIPQPEGKIIYLAATKSRLYALCMEGHGVNATLRYIENNGDQWVNINSTLGEYPLIQSIYADPDTEQLFAGARKKTAESYAIMYLDTGDDMLKLLISETAVFSGAVYRGGFYYLCTKGAGIFRINENDISENTIVPQLNEGGVSDSDRKNDRMFMSMIKLQVEDYPVIIAVERNGGALYEVDEDSFKGIKYSSGDKAGDSIATGKYATGALALWEKPGEPDTKMLIAGIQGSLYNTTSSSYTHGYVEFDLDSDGSINTDSLRHDPGNLQSAPDNDRYTATIGKHPINHLFQTPDYIDDDMIFFASTQTAGLWSYKDRQDKEGPQWNAEE